MTVKLRVVKPFGEGRVMLTVPSIHIVRRQIKQSRVTKGSILGSMSERFTPRIYRTIVVISIVAVKRVLSIPIGNRSRFFFFFINISTLDSLRKRFEQKKIERALTSEKVYFLTRRVNFFFGNLLTSGNSH